MRTYASLALALLLLGTTIVVTPAAAQSQNTDLTVRPSPFFPNPDDSCAIMYARPAPAESPNLVQKRTVRLMGTTGAYDKIVFSYALAPNPGSPVAPGLDRAIKWDLGSSGAEGWNVIVNNGNLTNPTPGAVRTLTFEKGSLVANTARDFRIAFVVPQNAVGDTPNPSAADNYPVSVTALNTKTGSTDTTSDARSLCIKIDNTPPSITRAVTRDSTQDGHLDRMEINFTEAIDPDSIFKDEFAVHNMGKDENAYALFPPLKPAFGREKTLILNLAPGIRYDTGDVPELVYPASIDRPDRPNSTSLTDLAGNRMARVTADDIKEIDGAKPVLVSAFAPVRAEEILLTFSEPVFGGGGPTSPVTVEDLRYRDSNSIPDCIETPLESQLELLRHEPGGSTAHQVSIFLKAPIQVCEGDFDKTFEGWQLADSQNPPSECDIDGPVTWEPSLSAGTCSKAIHDAVGLTALPIGTLPVKNTSPMVVASGGAEVSIGTSQLALKFNGPVSGASDFVPIDIKSLDIVSADGTGQGPGGIVAVQHRPGSALAILSLDKPVRPTDVDDSPARVRIKCDLQGNSQIKGTAVNAFVPCFDPDGDTFADVPMVDQTPPSILEARTYDGDRDGYIDGYYLIMSEPVDDASFCAGPTPNMPAPYECNPGKAAPTTVPCCGKRPDNGNSLTIDGIPGPYTWDTDLKPNDDQGIIRFQDGLLASYQMPPIRTNCIASDLPGKVCGGGLFADLAHLYPNAQFPYTTANKMKEICADNSICATFVQEIDGAPPAIWDARTVDTPVFDPDAEANNKTEGNGWIDGYRLTFSEPVEDVTFHASEWTVAGHNVTGFRSFERGEEYLRDLERLLRDDRITVLFDETKRECTASVVCGDTAARPELTYKPLLGGIKDQRGNAMRILQPIDVDERDGSPPTITAIEAPHALPDPKDPSKVYYTTAMGEPSKVTVRFSEPVDDGNLGSLIRANFVYGNAFAPGNAAVGSGVSGMTSQNAITHKAGDAHAVLTLNGMLTQFDMDEDCLGANAASVYEVSPTVPANQRQAAGVTCRPLDFAPDTLAPGAVSGLAVTQAVTTANAVTLTWKAPGDDGQGHGAVSGYIVKVSKEEINQTNFDTSAIDGDVLATSAVILGGPAPHRISSGGLVFEFSPDVGAFAQPGQTQSLSISGLQADQEYYFAVKAFDSAQPAQVGPMSAVVTATTAQDFTPPVPAPVISSTSHRANTASALNNAVFQWTESKDPEGAPTYCFALNKEASYTINPKKDSTCTRTLSHTISGLASGTHVFHVAAVSGGGQTATAHYTIIVGAAKLDPQDIEAANSLLRPTTKAERVDGVNKVSWTLPDEDQLPPGASVSAVRVYRFQEGKGVLVKEIPGTYETLRNGTYVDNSTDAKEDSLYRVDMVFKDGQVQGESITGFTRVVDVTPQPGKLLPFLIVLAIFVVAMAAAFAVIYASRRGKAPTGPTTPAGIDAETGLPTHDVRCPSCQTAFQAVGNLPLQIGCPRCGVSGLLQ